MRLLFYLFLLLSLALACQSKKETTLALHIGDPAPSLSVTEWLKGTPIQNYEKGKVYVLECWATWCKPCKAAMPHLSELARKYRDKVSFIGIDILELNKTSLQTIRAFVDSMGNRMDYTVIIPDSSFMKVVINALNENGGGIPKTFVINTEGVLAWIGHPRDLEKVLPQIINNTWNTKEAESKRQQDKYLQQLDDSLNHELNRFRGDFLNPDDLGKPDSALLAIEEIVRKEPGLKYAPLMAGNTFFALLKTDQQKALEYGKVAIVTPTYEQPAFDMIIGSIELLAPKFNFSTEIYQLCAEAYELKIKNYPYPELVKMPLYYNNLAECYWRIKNKSKAIYNQQKAIEEMKSRSGYPQKDLPAYEARLRKYQSM